MPSPARRWFQFKLSTWFVLMWILAWALATPLSYEDRDITADILNDAIQKSNEGREAFSGYWGFDRYRWFWKLKRSLAGILLPALALAAFVGWKVAWLMSRSRKGSWHLF